MTEIEAWMILNGLPGVGPITVKRLCEHFYHDPRNIFCASKEELLCVNGVGEVLAGTVLNWNKYFDVKREREVMEKKGIRFICKKDREYPEYLKEIHDMPIGLYVWGRELAKERCLAIVGTRRPTAYGMGVARQLAGDLAAKGFCVVSGLARGIDSVAHEAVLQGGGHTIGVLGCGVDMVYPPENGKLFERMKEEGTLVSEFPLGHIADKTTFPRRNRIISGLVEGVIVVETAMNGGSMITARLACDQGRRVFAVPGRVDQEASQGCHYLIREGATLCTGVGDILEDLREGVGQVEMDFGRNEGVEKKEGKVGKRKKIPEDLNEKERKVLEVLLNMGVGPLDWVATNTGIGVGEVSSLLLMLELKKLVKKRIDGGFEAMEGLVA